MTSPSRRFPKIAYARRVERVADAMWEWVPELQTLLADHNRYMVTPIAAARAGDRITQIDDIAAELAKLALRIRAMS